ncbi:MAG: hypothetical protein OFPII_31530 [Osedax symbiont Rs1]|nr:MAG: hypothetical protein OFPII_31530 [Osedax symbiont Rs1]
MFELVILTFPSGMLMSTVIFSNLMIFNEKLILPKKALG